MQLQRIDVQNNSGRKGPLTHTVSVPVSVTVTIKVALTAGHLLALVHSSTNMLKSLWASDFWKPLLHTNMSKNFGKY